MAPSLNSFEVWRLRLFDHHIRGWDLREIYVGLRMSVLMSWVLPAAVLGLGLPCLLVSLGWEVPGLLLWSGVPYYHAKTATAALREKLGPYMNEAPFSIRLLTNHITKWHVFDTDTERYLTWEEAERRLEEQQLDQGKESLGAHGADEGPPFEPDQKYLLAATSDH
ncbi:omega-6 fatty acid desaturase [Haematococcus lacustris]|uniref:Omega-6 fatty acid desaturase n=1 Tax=Haematococcus lacustris TaxID=44745 RepID=A0A699YLU8_HAELA|nr:omega-6 fatty acid desaturase [Haematococcus lacustris]